MNEPDVSQILKGIRAIAASDSVPVNERLEALTKIAQAAEEHEDKLSFPGQADSGWENRLQ